MEKKFAQEREELAKQRDQEKDRMEAEIKKENERQQKEMQHKLQVNHAGYFNTVGMFVFNLEVNLGRITIDMPGKAFWH